MSTLAAGELAPEFDLLSHDGTRVRISYLIGPDRRIVKAYDPVKPAEHAAQVLADVP